MSSTGAPPIVTDVTTFTHWEPGDPITDDCELRPVFRSIALGLHDMESWNKILVKLSDRRISKVEHLTRLSFAELMAMLGDVDGLAKSQRSYLKAIETALGHSFDHAGRCAPATNSQTNSP